jgi:hypothetical protein
MSTTMRDTAAACASSTVRGDFHPMEVIPFFRRFRPGPVRNVVYTFLFDAIIGTGFWTVAMMDNHASRNVAVWLIYLLFANVIGYTIHVLFGLGSMSGLERHVRGPWMTTAYYTGVSLAGVMLGSIIASAALQSTLPRFLFDPQWIATSAAVSLLISAILSVIFFPTSSSTRSPT